MNRAIYTEQRLQRVLTVYIPADFVFALVDILLFFFFLLLKQLRHLCISKNNEEKTK